MNSDKSFQVFYRLEVHGHITDWQLLVMDKPYGDTIKGPDLLTTIHWRGRDIGLALQKLESDVCKMVEFKVVELKPLTEEETQDMLSWMIPLIEKRRAEKKLHVLTPEEKEDIENWLPSAEQAAEVFTGEAK